MKNSSLVNSHGNIIYRKQGRRAKLVKAGDNNGPQVDGGPTLPENHRIEIIYQDKKTTFPLIKGTGTVLQLKLNQHKKILPWHILLRSLQR